MMENVYQYDQLFVIFKVHTEAICLKRHSLTYVVVAILYQKRYSLPI